jgi:hypothetical protein
MGDVDTPGRMVKTFVTFVHRAIAKKHALSRTKGQFTIIVRTKVGRTLAAESTKERVVRRLVEETLYR